MTLRINKPKPEGQVILERLLSSVIGFKSDEPDYCDECKAIMNDPFFGGCLVTPSSHRLPNAPPCKMNP